MTGYYEKRSAVVFVHTWRFALLALGAGGREPFSAVPLSGHQFPTEKVHQIQIGQTTQADIKRMFGEPWRTGVEDGYPTWTYGIYHYSLIQTQHDRSRCAFRPPEAGQVILLQHHRASADVIGSGSAGCRSGRRQPLPRLWSKPRYRLGTCPAR